MKNRRPSPKPVDTIDSISERLSRLTLRIGSLTDVDPDTLQRVQGLVDTANYLLINCCGEVFEEEPNPSDDLPSSPPVRSLRREWAGGLPDSIPAPVPTPSRKRTGPSYDDLKNQYGNVASRYSSTDVSKLKDSKGISGPDPNKYETTYNIDSSANCPDCRGSSDSHPIDRRLPLTKDGEGTQYIAHIMCDGTRAYLPATDNDK